MKLAVIGVGAMGKNHARIYANHENVELVAVADLNEELTEKVRKKFSVATYTDYIEMLDKEDIDAVSIAVPTRLHKEVALEVLKRKKHVLLEKPIAITVQDAWEIIRSARENNVMLMIGHIERFNPVVVELKRRLHLLGEIYKIEVQRVGPFPSRVTEIGVIKDLSVHDIDIIHYLTGQFPSRLYAERQQKLHPTSEDSVTSLLRYNNDMKATLNVNYLSPNKRRQLRVFGEKGMLEIDYISQELYFYENPGYVSNNWDSVIEGDIHKINISRREPLANEIDAFIGAISNFKESPVSGEHALKVLHIAELMDLSARENKIVTVEF